MRGRHVESTERTGAAMSQQEAEAGLPLSRTIDAKRGDLRSKALIGVMKKLLEQAQASLTAFEKVLMSKKAKAVVAEAARARLAATSAEIRTTVKALAALR
jgi:hypothetical protein